MGKKENDKASDKRKKVILELMEQEFYIPMKEKSIFF